MAAEVRTWLADLRSSDPPAARAVGADSLALLMAGDILGPPAVRELGPAAALDDTHLALDHAYQRGLDIMQDARRAAAEAAWARKRAEDQLGEAQALLARFQGQRRRAAADGNERLIRQLAVDEATARDHLAGLAKLLDRAATTEGRLIAFTQRLQQRVEAFRTRKEVLKATYTAAAIEGLIEDAMTALQDETGPGLTGAEPGPAEPCPAKPGPAKPGPAEPGPAEPGPAETAGGTARSVVVARPRQIRAAVTAFNQEIRNEFQQAGLARPKLAEAPQVPDILELRPSGPGRLTRILFAFEPPDVPVLLAVQQISDQAEDVARLAAERLQQARAAGSAGQAGRFSSYAAPSFLAEFFPDEGQDISARAADLIARASSRTLAETRIWTGLTQAQVAVRMNVRQERISAIERGELAATEIRTLAAFVRALGGRLEVAADFAGERIVLR
jgi:hypothetical protein